MITAEGIKKGKKMLVKYNNDGSWIFNGSENKILEKELYEKLKETPSIFGTYYAGAPYEKLNIVGVLREYFFDKPADVFSDEEIVVPDWEDDVVY